MNDMREIIVRYNARSLGYGEGLESNVLASFERDPKPKSAIYVSHERFGIELGTVIAFYETRDPTGLVEKLVEAYGEAISEVEEGTPMHALDAGYALGSEPASEDTTEDGSGEDAAG